MMSVMKKVEALNAPEKSFEEKLYMVLSAMDYNRNGYNVRELGEEKSVIEQVIWGWWKPRYLIDTKNCRAYEIMNGNMDFVHFTTDDVDWASIEQLPEKAKMQAQAMSAEFPTFIRDFSRSFVAAQSRRPLLYGRRRIRHDLRRGDHRLWLYRLGNECAGEVPVYRQRLESLGRDAP